MKLSTSSCATPTPSGNSSPTRTLELFTDCLAAEAIEGCSWRAHYRGGDYIAVVRSDDDFSPSAYVAETCARLGEV